MTARDRRSRAGQESDVVASPIGTRADGSPWPVGGALIGLAALAHHPDVRAASSKAAALTLAALTLVALGSPRWWRRPAWSPAIGALTLLVGLLAISLVWSPHPSPAALGPWLVALGLALCAPKASAAEGAASVLLVGSGALWVLGVPHGGHGNPNWLGLTAAVALPLVVDRARRPEARWWYLLASAAGFGLLVAGASRAAVIGVAAAALWLAPGRVKAVALAPLALLALFADHALAAARGRLDLFGDAWRAVSWPLGAGLGGFHRAFLEAQAERLRDLPAAEAARQFVNAETAHHDLLQLLVEAGPLAALALLALFATAFLALRERAPGAAGAVVVLAVAGLGDTALALPAVAALLGLLVGATAPHPAARGGESPERRVHESRAEPAAGRRAARAPAGGAARLATLAVAAGLVALAPRLTTGWLAQRALGRAQAEGAGSSSATLAALAEIAPHDAEIALALGVAHLDEGDAVAAQRVLDRARGLTTSVAVELALGRAHLVLGDLPAARAAFARALGLHPASFRALLAVAEADRRAGAYDEARRALDRARVIRPHDARLRELDEALRRDTIDAATR